MKDPLVDKYLDVLHNIEFALTGMYREHAKITDWEARDAVKALIRVYQAELRGRATPTLQLNPLAQEMYDAVKAMCDWHLGRKPLMEKDGQPIVLTSPKTVSEIVECLKFIHRSIELWQKDGGRRGYYNFIREFVT